MEQVFGFLWRSTWPRLGWMVRWRRAETQIMWKLDCDLSRDKDLREPWEPPGGGLGRKPLTNLKLAGSSLLPILTLVVLPLTQGSGMGQAF